MLIVSCQSGLGIDFDVRCAVAAEMGGADAVRVAGKDTVERVKDLIKIPVIGLTKRYCNEGVKITWTLKQAESVSAADYIATSNIELIPEMKQIAPIVADVATYEDGLRAYSLGAEWVATTLSGYTKDSPILDGPDTQLALKLREAGIQVIAEGRYRELSDVRRAMDAGCAVCIGSAITSPHEITRRYVKLSS
jgi:N-acylglucosamine-6-phosphate 2-epimerase